MRIVVWDDLPVHPWHTCIAKCLRPGSQISCSCTFQEYSRDLTIVVGSVVIASAPFLHDELLVVLYSFCHVWCEFVLGQVACAIRVDANDIDARAAEVSIKQGRINPATAACCYENVRVAIQGRLDCVGHGTLPVRTDGSEFGFLEAVTAGLSINISHAHIIVHGLILSFKSKDVLAALAPGLPVVRIDVGENMKDPVLKLLPGIGICVETTRAIPSTIEVIVRL